MKERQKTINGIYKFVSENINIVNYELNKIPQGSLINYNRNHIFDIEYDAVGPFSLNLRVYTKLPGDNSSQGHVYIKEDDKIQYINNSKIVMDIIIETYMREQREQKLNQIGI
jgi:hypothetical protein